jgi:predicted ATPase/Tfp pilus assembly protein PilF
LRESRGFEEWSLLQRERLRRLVIVGLHHLVRYCLETHHYQAGIHHADKVITLDPYDEEARRQMMWLLWRSGQRNAALQQYQACRHFLSEQLNVEPSSTTLALYTRIRATPFPPPHVLPAPPALFVGREVEGDEINRRLASPHCHLLTLLGPGGMGKTRLAIEIAQTIRQQRPGQFLDGIYFVSLVGLQTADSLPTTLADTLDMVFQGTEPAGQQLLHFLQEREILLILDNFEHLIGEHSLALLGKILEKAPACKVLVTSRERLRLVEEEVFDLAGLAYPPPGAAEVASYSAVQLFGQQARRVQPEFAPTGDEQEALVQLCRLVEGMPLAIELAAAGIRYFSCQDILQQLQRSLDVDFSPIRNRRSRHQNLRTVFEHSWSLLAAEEQQIAQRFAVFRGQFDMAAAEAVTQASRAQVALLLDKSFLQSYQAGWLDIHPLLHQFLSEKLNRDPEEMTAVRQRHADHFSQLSLDAGQGTMERHYHALRKILLPNIENMIAAALWTAEQHDFANRRLVTLLERLIFYFNQLSWRFETLKITFRQLIEALQVRPDGSYEERWVTAVLQSRIAYADFRLHAHERARPTLEALLPQASALKNGALLSFCQHILGLLASRAGDYQTAFQYLESAVEAVKEYPSQYQWPVYRSLGEVALAAGQLDKAQQAHETAFALALERDSYDEAAPIYELAMGSLAHRRGQLTEAQQRLTRAVELARMKASRLEIVLSLERLGWVMADLGELETAHRLLTEAEQLISELKVANALKDSRILAFVKLAQGWQAECAGHLSLARTFYEQSATMFERVADRVAHSMALAHLGRCCLHLGERETAEHYLQQALTTFQAWDHRGGIALALIGLGLVYQASGNNDAGQTLFKQAWETAVSGGEGYIAMLARKYWILVL